MGRTVRPALLLLLLSVVMAACHDGVDPIGTIPGATQAELDRIQVSASTTELSTGAPGNTVALTIKAFDKSGVQISSTGGVVSYTSHAPSTAGVSGDGVVTALAAGTAVITGELTLRGVTRTSDVTISVLGPGSWPTLGGVYDLVGTVARSDFDPTFIGGQQRAVVTIQHNGDSIGFLGTYTDFRAIAPGVPDPLTGSSGTVTGTVGTDGRIVLELWTGQSGSSYWYSRGMLTGQEVTGDYEVGGGVITGTFAATRR